MTEWFGENAFAEIQLLATILGMAGIIAGLIFNGLNYRRAANERRIANLFSRTAAHRQIWYTLLAYPALKRAIEPNLPKIVTPSVEERIWVRSLILHFVADFHAHRFRLSIPEKGLEKDVRQFFAKPIPKIVWDESRHYQDPAFVAFVEKCRRK